MYTYEVNEVTFEDNEATVEDSGVTFEGNEVTFADKRSLLRATRSLLRSMKFSYTCVCDEIWTQVVHDELEDQRHGPVRCVALVVAPVQS